jgi:hypothetical protein
MLKNLLTKMQYIKPTLNYETSTNNCGKNKTPRTPYFEPLYDEDKPTWRVIDDPEIFVVLLFRGHNLEKHVARGLPHAVERPEEFEAGNILIFKAKAIFMLNNLKPELFWALKQSRRLGGF